MSINHGIGRHQQMVYYDAPPSPQSETPFHVASRVLGQLVKRSDSPLSRFCEGWCRMEYDVPEELPNVVCITSGDDAQISWEGEYGWSMTQLLVNILKDNPHPTLEGVMVRLGHANYARCYALHKRSRKYHQKMEQQNKEREKNKLPPLEESFVEVPNVQDPQMCSLKPLDMKSPLVLNPSIKF
ncbi:hypothetical protein BDN72DRAFT_877103 [Pluteus cervinus]|uniref:Uncharacterized protein n=1 Tax=Pluteus cervinus TaxID=181527 RepID=A0ACD3B1L1_9AGAR|nr:hypothetical protein BDN72DRAFT_877103 [Pluteus cervinus]